MPTSFQFNSTQLAEIKRLRDIATRPENKQVPGGGADLYRYIFKAVTGIDVDGKPIRLAPGMNVTAEIKTGKRRVIEYLLSPIEKAGRESLRER